MVGKHKGTLSGLYYIHNNGEAQNIVDYFSFGSGKQIVDTILKKVKCKDNTMKEFARSAYCAIMYMNTQPDSRVGVEPDAFPTIIYLDYNKEWNEEASEKDIEEFRIFTEKKLVEYYNQLENLHNSF